MTWAVGASYPAISRSATAVEPKTLRVAGACWSQLTSRVPRSQEAPGHPRRPKRLKQKALAGGPIVETPKTTLPVWSLAAGMSYSTLLVWCQTADLRESTSFAWFVLLG